ncbi:MAG: hypothetical protein EBX52_08160 [Proteobacteria bacterium]|nr:hypothetical protein [Pseudomonadota bacterium]
MNLKPLLAFLIAVLAPTAVLEPRANAGTRVTTESECTRVDLRPMMGKVRSQGDKGWCYANAAADLLSFFHRGELGGQQISAAYTALTTLRHLTFWGSTGNGGFILAGIVAAEEYGFCPNVLEREVMNTGLVNRTLSERIDILQKLKDDWDRAQEGDQAARSAFVDQYAEYVKTSSIVAKIPFESLKEVLNQSTHRTFIQSFAKKLCSGQLYKSIRKPSASFASRLKTGEIILPLVPPYWMGPFLGVKRIPPISWNPLSWNQDYIARINAELSRNNIVGIDYFSNFLNTDYLSRPDSLRTGMHSSVLVGRRWNPRNTRNSKCEYLIRNSWGEGCEAYGIKNHPGYCESGNIWVPENILDRNLIGYLYLN